ncbi:PREDICTED: 5-hydroxytryptamine receptor 3A-like isoform X2 [Cyprinodon variegatus]|uniref:5-hydroxytryptamine receptor 3A-like isoform X2 n=1 Tax=Cyprinodon variegatus TaxID=28743 RepID=UPI0007427F19|nr:PREDICTED: 5-hydroxytryptamine receptor 3A-like isoform X2 [Cyprinodon variegatus]
MTCTTFLLLVLILTNGGFCKVCSYQDVLDYLNLTADSSLFKITRPVLDHTHITVVKLDLIVYAILAVVEKTQTFVPFIWGSMQWKNELISWDPAQFCGITQTSVPRDLLWKPDLFIYEMIEKDNSPGNPNVVVNFDGTVIAGDDIRVVSTCKMDVYKFPFDTQQCNISLGSGVYCINEMRIIPYSNSSRVTEFSQEIMKTQGEWEFLHLTVSNSTHTHENRSWDVLTYTLGFKVTVLLAISVLLLILNEILPAMSNKTPLIATYCIVIFALMLVSLLETILVTYLIEKDEIRSQETKKKKLNNTNTNNDEKGDEKRVVCNSICRESEKDNQHELLPALEEVYSSLQSEESRMLLLILDELQKLQKKVYIHLGGRDEKMKFVSWAKRINRYFFVCYTITISLFLFLIWREWKS